MSKAAGAGKPPKPLAKIGDTGQYYVQIRVCAYCGGRIDGIVCTFGCPADAEEKRPPGSVIVQEWEYVETLMTAVAE